MKISMLDVKSTFLVPVFLALFVFFMPISPSLKSVFFFASLITILFSSYYNRHLAFVYNSLWGRAAICFFICILVACLWSEAPFTMQLMLVEKYLKVIILPVLAMGFIDKKTRNWTLNSYLAAIVVTCTLSVLKAKGIIHIGADGDNGDVFYNHIVTSFMVSFGCYLSGSFLFTSKGWVRRVYLMLMLFFSYQIIFINDGRTGYFIYFILMILLFFQIFSMKKAVLGMMLFCSIFLLCFSQSHVMQSGVSNLLKDVKQYQQNQKNTSLGYRVQFHNYAHSLFAIHPVVGIGTGGFKYSYSKDQPILAWGIELTDPHSQYWLTLTEQGIIGLVLLLVFLGSLFVSSFKLSETRPILLGILLAFCIGAFTDTILCYSAAGYLLVVMSALSFGELIEKQALKNKVKERVAPDLAIFNESQIQA